MQNGFYASLDNSYKTFSYQQMFDVSNMKPCSFLYSLLATRFMQGFKNFVTD